jgi:hypothetical protein
MMICIRKLRITELFSSDRLFAANLKDADSSLPRISFEGACFEMHPMFARSRPRAGATPPYHQRSANTDLPSYIALFGLRALQMP